MKHTLIKTSALSATPDNLTFQPPAEPFQPSSGSTFSFPLSPKAIPRLPQGKMTRRKRVRLRKLYNRLRHQARIGKVQLVMHSYLHGAVVLKENP